MSFRFTPFQIYYLRALAAIFSLLIISSACKREEKKSIVPAFDIARKIQIKTGVNGIFTLTGSFDYSSEKMNFSGNFWLEKDSSVATVKVFGPLGLGNRRYTINNLGLDILNFLFGFADTLSGVLIVRGNVYSSPDGGYSFITDKNGLVLSVSADDYKIYLMDYKKHEKLVIPHKIRVIYRDGVLNIRIKQVGLPS